MKILLVSLLLALSLSTFADDYKHIVTFGSNGFGWSGASEKMETNKESVFSDVDYFLQNIGVNYGYRISERFVIGGFASNNHFEYKFNTPSSTASVRETITVYGLYTLYHFSDTISTAWYTGLSISQFNRSEETSHKATIAESKTPFELDDTGMTYELLLGKRFSLKKWNIDHLTFAPQVSLYQRVHGRDFDDQDVKHGFGYTFQPVRFDFLF